MTAYMFNDLMLLSHINIQCAANLSNHHCITNTPVRFSQYNNSCQCS